MKVSDKEKSYNMTLQEQFPDVSVPNTNMRVIEIVEAFQEYFAENINLEIDKYDLDEVFKDLPTNKAELKSQFEMLGLLKEDN